MLPVCDFNPRPPRGGRLQSIKVRNSAIFISIHAPREGGDNEDFHDLPAFPLFQSTPPARGATSSNAFLILFYSDFNPRPPRGGRLLVANSRQRPSEFQSTPPARGATLGLQNMEQQIIISIHAPREGGDPKGDPKAPLRALFQSTPPARGATLPAPWHPRPDGDFNPRPPRGGRLPLTSR